MQKLKVAITDHDISEAAWFRITNPILFVLQNTTGTLWKMHDDGNVCEVMKPYRAGRLSAEAMTRWREYSEGRPATPFEFEIELEAPLSENTFESTPAPLETSMTSPHSALISSGKDTPALLTTGGARKNHAH